MSLSIGTKLGPYEIEAAIGAGGMGEVYRARDPRMGREVAIKVCSERFSERFEREVRAVAALNHPNICHIYDVGPNYLVMELVEGPTLAERIAPGAIPLEESLPIARQIAEALEAAHEKGIIHRDLKPANIKITQEGMVKVLDFGLAKAVEQIAPSGDPSNSPTLTMAATQAGVILGTAAYMSPEQAKGKTVDRRCDIWAFGCVLYEMLTGQRAFKGETVTDMLAAVLRAEPEWNELPASTPPAIQKLLRRCLEKDLKRRLQAIGEARFTIDETLSGATEAGAIHEAPPHKSWMRTLPWALAAILALVLVALTISNALHAPRPPARSIARLVVTLPPTDRMGAGPLGHVALAPDGSRLVYAANRGGSTQLYLRPLDRFEATPIPGTEGAESPFFSPDGQSVGFFAEGKLKKLSLSGGAALSLCSAPANRGGSWGPDDALIFAPSLTSGLFRVSAAGGMPKPLTVPDRNKGEWGHRYPQILPGGRAVLFTVWTGVSFDNARIDVLSLETSERRVLVEGGTYARYVPSGHLVYARAGGLLAVPFDLTRLKVTGPPVSMLEGVSMPLSFGAAEFGVSTDGSLAYIPGGSSVGERTLLWMGRKGAPQPLPAPPRPYRSPRLSPDGQRLAVATEGTNMGVWLYDLGRDTLALLTTSAFIPFPVWTPDGKYVTFGTGPSGVLNLYRMPADGSGAEERLTTSDNPQWPGSWSPDGQVFAFSELGPDTGYDIWLLGLQGERKPRPFLQTPSNEYGPIFSPDGRWLAYGSDETGRREIYVRPFPGPGGRWQISTEGGTEPMWARNGQELFYRNGEKMMATAIETKPAFAAAKPTLLFEGQYETSIFAFERDYDVSPDGQRFLMIKASEQESAARQINVVLNWSDELRRLVPAGKR